MRLKNNQIQIIKYKLAKFYHFYLQGSYCEPNVGTKRTSVGANTVRTFASEEEMTIKWGEHALDWMGRQVSAQIININGGIFVVFISRVYHHINQDVFFLDKKKYTLHWEQISVVLEGVRCSQFKIIFQKMWQPSLIIFQRSHVPARKKDGSGPIPARTV